MNNGIAIIVILLVPVLFQVARQGYVTGQRHRELLRRLDALEKKVDSRRT